MAPSLKLNVDVLAIACEFLTDVSDVLSMTLTSSTVYPVALRWLLRMRPVYIKSGPSVRRFHIFLFADEPARAPHIRALHIDLRHRHPAQTQDEDCSLLLHILASCKHLQHLTIAFHRVTLPIVEEPNFLHAITTIPSLRSFSVRSTSFDGISLLPSFRIPLCGLSIHSSNGHPDHRYPATLEEFLPDVIVQTLETLELDRFAVDPLDAQYTGDDIHMPSIFSVAPYPAVRSLSVSAFRSRPLLGHLQHLFPALDGTLNIGSLDIWDMEDSADEIREANQRAQDGDGGSRSSPRAWKKLDRVVCDAPMFYVLALRCPVRLAIIYCGSVENYHYAVSALRENPVQRLTLTMYHESGMLAGLFSPEIGERLTHLTLCLLYANYYYASEDDPPQFHWDDVLAKLIAAIRPLHKLTHLRVVVGANVYVPRGASWPYAPWGEYAHSLRRTRFDFDGTAAALACAFPSLQYVFLTTGGCFASWEEGDPEDGGRWKRHERWHASRGWRVGLDLATSEAAVDVDEAQGGGNGGSLVELHEDVVETIIRREELVLSEGDEIALHLSHGWHEPLTPLSL